MSEATEATAAEAIASQQAEQEARPKSRWERKARKQNEVSVRGVVFRERGDTLADVDVLLVEDLDEEKRAEWRAENEPVGRCAVPGGGMKEALDWGDSVRAITREMEEETGLLIPPSGVSAPVYTQKKGKHEQRWYVVPTHACNGALDEEIAKEPRIVDGIPETGAPEWWTLEEFLVGRKEGRVVEGKDVVTHFSHRQCMVHVLGSQVSRHSRYYWLLQEIVEHLDTHPEIKRIGMRYI